MSQDIADLVCGNAFSIRLAAKILPPGTAAQQSPGANRGWCDSAQQTLYPMLRAQSGNSSYVFQSESSKRNEPKGICSPTLLRAHVCSGTQGSQSAFRERCRDSKRASRLFIPAWTGNFLSRISECVRAPFAVQGLHSGFKNTRPSFCGKGGFSAAIWTTGKSQTPPC